MWHDRESGVLRGEYVFVEAASHALTILFSVGTSMIMRVCVHVPTSHANLQSCAKVLDDSIQMVEGQSFT